MRHVRLVLSLITMLASSSALAGEPVWQLGVEDASNQEFLPFSSKEFRTSQAVMTAPSFDLATHRFTYRIPAGQQLVAKPAFPGGISGTGAANPSWINHEEIAWSDPAGGPRVFSAVLLPSRAWIPQPGKANENSDPDGAPTIRRALRITMPNGALGYVSLPAQPDGPIPVRFAFTAAPGDNRIVLTETSGWTYGRCWNWDVLRVESGTAPAPNPVAVELVPDGGFAEGLVHLAGSRPRLAVQAYHLPPGTGVTGTAVITDFFDQQRSLAFTLAAGPDGRATTHLALPSDRTGRQRVAVRLDGLTLQLGLAEIAVETACIRAIAPLSEAEKDASFLGLCGLEQTIFDPYEDRAFTEMREAAYRRYRGLLQIHHERYHSLRWPYLEPQPGVRRWEFWDKLVDAEVAAGIRLQFAILGRPEWMSRQLQPDARFYWNGYYGMPDPTAWAGLCAAVAERYRGKIAEIELWNEPSAFSLFWPARSAADYARLIETGSRAIKAVAPELPVVAQTVWSRQPEFWRELHQLGAWPFVDYHADHYWTDERLASVNAFLGQAGRGRGLYANESKSGGRSPLGDMTAADRRRSGQLYFRNILYGQAQGVLRNYEFLLFSPTDRLYGLFGPDLAPKPNFCIQKTLVNRTTGATLTRYLTLQGGAIEAWLYRFAPGVRQQENGAATMLVLAARSESRLRLPVGQGPLALVDVMDNARPLAAVDGILELRLNADPVMVLGVDAETVLAQDALAITSPDEAAPGATVAATLRLRDPRPVTVRVEPPGAEAVPVALDAAHPERRLEWRIAATMPEGMAAIRLTGMVGAGSAAVALDQSVPLLVTSAAVERNLLGDAPFAGARPALRVWGGTGCRADGDATGLVELPATGSGGIVTTTALPVLAGRPYLVSARVSGSGEAAGRIEIRNAAGTVIRTEHRLIATRLGAQPVVLAAIATMPAEAASLTLNLLLYQTTGSLHADAIRIERVASGRPAHRAAFRARAIAMPPDCRAGDLLSEPAGRDIAWGGQAGGVTITGYRGGTDCSASARIGISGDRLLIACTVTDDLDRPDGDLERLWQSDSLQLDLDPGPGISGAATCQFSIGRVGGRTRVVRHSTIPSEDIVPSYRAGSDPDGITAVVVRDGATTTYMVAIAATAIWPNLDLAPGRELGLSLLVNDDDGEGRRGWIEWGGGIGNGHDPARFGSLTLDTP